MSRSACWPRSWALAQRGCGQRFTTGARAVAAGPLQGACVAPVPAGLVRPHSGGPRGSPLGRPHIPAPHGGDSSLTISSPLLVVLSRRPEPDPGVSALEATLGGAPDLRLRKIELAPLADEAERDVVNTLLGGVAAEDVSAFVRQGAEGNPLFLEERFASLMETGALLKTSDQKWRLETDGQAELPEAIERLVRSRVDRLAPAPREAIVAASVLGRVHFRRLLKTVTEPDGELLPAVSELCSAGLLVQAANVPEATFRFRHSLIQEATYKGLLRAHRATLHSRAAWGLEQASAGRLEEVAGLLGHHYALAGEVERAAHYLALAGDRAALTFANDEARASYSWAIELLGRDPAQAVPVAEIGSN